MFKLTKTSYLALLLFSLGTISNSNCMYERAKNFAKTNPQYKYVIGAVAGVGAGMLSAQALAYLIGGTWTTQGRQYNCEVAAELLKRYPILYQILPLATTAITSFLAHKYSGLATALTAACTSIWGIREYGPNCISWIKGKNK